MPSEGPYLLYSAAPSPSLLSLHSLPPSPSHPSLPSPQPPSFSFLYTPSFSFLYTPSFCSLYTASSPIGTKRSLPPLPVTRTTPWRKLMFSMVKLTNSVTRRYYGDEHRLCFFFFFFYSPTFLLPQGDGKLVLVEEPRIFLVVHQKPVYWFNLHIIWMKIP